MSTSVDAIVNEEYLKTLMEMGVKEHIARKALITSNNECLNTALMIALEMNEELCDEDSDNSKMIFIVNSSLNMSVGKIAAQVAHAALNLYREIVSPQYLQFHEVLSAWERKGERKIVLKGNDEAELLELMEKARDLNLPCTAIRDAGRTEVAPNSLTVLAVYGVEECVNRVTGHLSLLY